MATVSSPHMVEIKDFNSASCVLTSNCPQGSQGFQKIRKYETIAIGLFLKSSKLSNFMSIFSPDLK